MPQPLWMTGRGTTLLKRRLASLATVAVQGTFFRSVLLEYAHDPLSALGSLVTGGRFNHVGDFEALYLADTPITALFEVQMLQESHGRLTPRKTPPRALFTVDVTVHRVISLCSADVRRKLGITLTELHLPWQRPQRRGVLPLSQRLGELAFQLGLEGLLVPSRHTKTSQNLVLFPSNLLTSSNAKVYTGKRTGSPHLLLRGTQPRIARKNES